MRTVIVTYGIVILPAVSPQKHNKTAVKFICMQIQSEKQEVAELILSVGKYVVFHIAIAETLSCTITNK